MRSARTLGNGRTLLTGLLWTAPWWLGFLLFLAVPMGYSLYISFCDYTLLQPPAYTGTANYQALAKDETFHKVLYNTFLFTLISVPLTTILAIFLAVLLNQRLRGQAFFRACIFVPTVVPLVAAGVVWMWILNPQLGLVNEVVRPIGQALTPIAAAAEQLPTDIAEPLAGVPTTIREMAAGPAWLDSPRWAMVALVMVSLWFVGSPMVIYLAGLQEIPEQLYEAARLDGASAARQVWHVTLPGLSPVILFNVVINIIGALQVFALPYVMWRTRQGPEGATYFYTSYLFDNAFRYLKMGYASSMAWIQLLLILALTGLVFWASRRMVHYEQL